MEVPRVFCPHYLWLTHIFKIFLIFSLLFFIIITIFPLCLDLYLWNKLNDLFQVFMSPEIYLILFSREG